jgi:uncharacterized protein (DUF305 family)
MAAGDNTRQIAAITNPITKGTIDMNSLPAFVRRAALAGLGLSLLALTARPDAPAPERSQARFEENFLSDMIDHHLVGEKMAELAATRATHPELRALASMIQTSQQAQIESMRDWLEEWHEVEYETEIDERGQRRLAALGELSGEEFEREFMAEMALHHADAIEAASEALLRSYHADVISLARDILSLQADELALLRIWLNQWHEVAQVTAQDRGIDVGVEAGDDESGSVLKPGTEFQTETDTETTPPPSVPSTVTDSPSGSSVATDGSVAEPLTANPNGTAPTGGNE